MRIINVEDLFSGMVVGMSLKKDGKLLVKEQTILTNEQLHLLKQELSADSPVWIFDVCEFKPVLKQNDTFVRNYVDYVVNFFFNLFSASVFNKEKFNELCESLKLYLANNRWVLYDLLLLKDNHSYTYEHSISVAMYSTLLGMALDLSTVELYDLMIGSILHDIGKLKISNSILNKPCKLEADEFQSIQKHPVYGLELSKNLKAADDRVQSIIIQHHEKLDGSGYPNHKVGNSINPLAKIVTVCDIFDAVTSARSYHTAATVNKGIEVLTGDVKAGKLDKGLVDILVQQVVQYPFNTLLKLSDNSVCVVVRDTGTKDKPLVLNCKTNELIDLNKRTDLCIVEAV